MPRMKAVLRCTRAGVPVSFSFFTTAKLWSTSSTTPVRLTRKLGARLLRVRKPSSGVLGAHRGA